MKPHTQITFLIIIWFFIYPPVAWPADTLPISVSTKTATYNIIDTHEHILDRTQACRYNLAIKKHNLTSIILVASPKEVLTVMNKSMMRFTDSEWNNNELLQIHKQAPDLFYAFATYSPDDTRIVEQLENFIKNGGKGIKLYNGHHRFYDIFNIRLDAPHLMKVYEYCEKNRVPIVFHANARYYWTELKNVLDTYPQLTVNLAHFCMSLIDLDRIREIFDNYENVYSDISCGEGELAYTTLEYISRYWEIYRELIKTYKTRFLFATDMVLNNDPKKDEQYVEGVVLCYRKMLEQRKYSGILLDLYLEDKHIEKTEDNSIFNGLQLDDDTLKHMYEINPRRFLGLSQR